MQTEGHDWCWSENICLLCRSLVRVEVEQRWTVEFLADVLDEPGRVQQVQLHTQVVSFPGALPGGSLTTLTLF